MGELEVFDDRAVFVGAFCNSSVHVCRPSMYIAFLQGIISNVCDYKFELYPNTGALHQAVFAYIFLTREQNRVFLCLLPANANKMACINEIDSGEHRC